MYYTVKQFAQMFNISEHTIRYYTDIGILPCKRDKANRRIFDDESVNWMQGITCLKGCGASMEDIKRYCELCLLDDSENNLKARYQIILKQREQAYKNLEEIKSTIEYIEEKVIHYKNILEEVVPDDSNPNTWTDEIKPKDH